MEKITRKPLRPRRHHEKGTSRLPRAASWRRGVVATIGRLAIGWSTPGAWRRGGENSRR